MRSGRLVIGALVVLAALAGGAWYVLLRDQTTPVSVREAVARFRASGSSQASTALLGSAPALGVYRYATSGSEQFDALLDGQHDYGPTSTVTVSRSACGLRQRWDALDDRWTAWEECLSPRRGRLRSLDEFHLFYGRSKRLSYRCSSRPSQRMIFAEVGRRWTTRCLSPDGSMVMRQRIVGAETLQVGGRARDTVRVHSEASLTGQSQGTTVIDSWLLRSNGLLIRRALHGDVRIADTPLGDVRHRERYLIKLQSLEPYR